MRLPISKYLLQHILFEVERLFNTVFTILLYQTAFLLAYYGLLRVGEITSSQHVIKAIDIHASDNKNKIMMILHSSKTHGPWTRPQKIIISATEQYETIYQTRKRSNKFRFFCPFDTTNRYLQLRGGYDDEREQLLIFKDGTPLTATTIRRILKKILARLGLNPRVYDIHSFRIGCATDLLKEGNTIETIKQCGRWRSNAVYKYLR